jgi:hypothetical protein
MRDKKMGGTRSMHRNLMNAYKRLAGNPEIKLPLGNLRRRREIILKWIAD